MSGGQANPAIRTMVGDFTPSDVDSSWVDTLVTHELTHMVFADATTTRTTCRRAGLTRGSRYTFRRATAMATGPRWPTQPVRRPDPLAGRVHRASSRRRTTASAWRTPRASRLSITSSTPMAGKTGELIISYRDGVTDDEAFLAATGGDFQAFDDAWVAAQGTSPPSHTGRCRPQSAHCPTRGRSVPPTVASLPGRPDMGDPAAASPGDDGDAPDHPDRTFASPRGSLSNPRSSWPCSCRRS